jgi:hypothetical protein
MTNKFFAQICILITGIFVNSNAFASLQHGHKFLHGLPQVHDEVVCELSDDSVIERSFKTQSGNYLSCHNISSFDDTLSRVAELVDNAPKVALFIQNRHNNASFDMGRIIRIPIQLEFSGKYGTTYSGNYMGVHTVLAHEYGHAIFSQKIKGYDFYKNIQKLSYQSSSYELAIQDAYAKGNPGNIVDFYHKQKKHLFEKRKNDPYFQKVAKLSTPYNELFSDVVAVVAKNDKRAVMMALYYDEMSDQQYQIVQGRSFEVNSLDNFGPHMSLAHTKLAATRQFIGKNLWPENDKQASELINTVFDAIVIELQKDLESNDERSTVEKNKSLIKTLSELYKID